MLHIYDELEQGSEAWHNQRRGIVTASVVGKLLTVGPPNALGIACPTCEVKVGPCLGVGRKTPTLMKTIHEARTAAATALPPVYEVADNDTSRALTATLAAERITGWTEESRMTDDMWRGVECEPIARDIYSGHYQQAVEVGFMRREEEGWTLGYSPDGLVADDGLIEIKSPRAKTHLNTILANEVPPHYMAQCQAGLLVSGRKWLDFVSYVGGMPLFVKRVHPDPEWFDAITAACIAFEENAAQIVAAYTAATAGLPQTERLDFNIVELKLA